LFIVFNGLFDKVEPLYVKVRIVVGSRSAIARQDLLYKSLMIFERLGQAALKSVKPGTSCNQSGEGVLQFVRLCGIAKLPPYKEKD
jgi:hypothetical protein